MITNSHQLLGNEMIGIVGGVLNGNKAGQTGGARASPASALIHFWNSHNVLVEDTQLKNAKWENLLFSICYNVLVKNVNSQGAGYQGIATEFGSHDVLITDCKTYNNEIDGILIAWNNVTIALNTTIHLPDGYNTIVSNCEAYDNGVYGISIEGYSNTHNITLTNCSIYGNAQAGVHIGTGSQLLLTNSNISDNGYACRVTISEQNPAATAPVKGLTISDSTIQDNTNGGIYLIGTSSSEMIQNVFITHNQFSNNTSHGGTDYYGVNATYQVS
jgi:parallel beta-helix repeat protein